MESKCLNTIFEELVESEKKIRDKRNYVNTLLQQIDRSEAQLSQLNVDLEAVRQQIQSKIALLPDLITNITINDNQIKIIWKQFSDFSLKKENLMQKLNRTNDELKNQIDMFVEHSFNFSAQFGLKGAVSIETIQLQKHIESLENQKFQLRSDVEKLKNSVEYFESVEKERKLMLDTISILEEKKKKLKSENIKLNNNSNRLMKEKKALEDMPNNGIEFLKLKQELENLKISDSSVVKSEFKKCSALIDNLKIDRQNVKTHTQPVLPTEQKNCGVNGKFEMKNIENEIKVEENDEKNEREKQWELYRKRQLQRHWPQPKRQQ